MMRACWQTLTDEFDRAVTLDGAGRRRHVAALAARDADLAAELARLLDATHLSDIMLVLPVAAGTAGLRRLRREGGTREERRPKQGT